MNFTFTFFLNSVLLGVGLAMDAFSVSIANGLNEPNMKKSKRFGIAGTYAFFQFAMPMIGWICVHTIVVYFEKFQAFIPWIALILLLFIGGKMIIDSVKEIRHPDENKDEEDTKLGFWVLMLQGLATSIDALSVGFTIAEYNWLMAIISSLIIAVVTLGICLTGLLIGRKVGERFSSKAEIVGGIILIGIGIEIFVKGVFF